MTRANFYLLNFSFWFLLAGFYAVKEWPQLPWHYVLFQFLIFLGFGFTITSIYRNNINRRIFSFDSVGKVIFTVLRTLSVLALCVVVYDFIIDRLHYRISFDNQPMYALVLVGYFIDGLVIFSPWFLLFHMYKYGRHTSMLDRLKAESESQLAQARLQVLMNKLNPHFLYNTLNTVRWLILSNPQKARQAVDQLADIMRYTTTSADNGNTTIQQELQIVERYLALESVRFEYLKYTIDVSDRLKDFCIPVFLVLNIVENAITHGISQTMDSHNIDISVTAFKETVYIEVSNDGVVDNAANGFGLTSLQTMLTQRYGAGARIDLKQVNEKVLTVVMIPKHVN